MRERTDLDREFEEHERACFAEQARLYRRLTDEERLARFCGPRARPELPEEVLRRVRAYRDREREDVLRRLIEALG